MRFFLGALSFLIFLVFCSCCGPKCKKPDNKDVGKNETIVGADQDEHGCKAAAGYQWSELRQDCIRSFELPMSILSPDKTSLTGVLFSADSSQVEIFSVQGHFMLERTASGHYEKTLKHQSAHLDRSQIGNWNWVFEN